MKPVAILAVGSVALDTVETEASRVDRVIGGSAVFFAAAASLLTRVRVVAVVGDDYPLGQLGFMRERRVDFDGLSQASGESFFWGGRYSGDFRTRVTTETRLGVFADFDPEVPEAYGDSRVVFLGNIDPVLQLRVLDQVRAPRLVAADTMNFWIERTPRALDRVLSRLDVLLLNDEEAMQLADDDDLTRAVDRIRGRGPEVVVVKMGDDGCVIFGRDWNFRCPAYPVTEVIDPTGAGDAFAGGFLGHLDRVGSFRRDDLRKAAEYGSAMGSYAVEAFSVDRFRTLEPDRVENRVRSLRQPGRVACTNL